MANISNRMFTGPGGYFETTGPDQRVEVDTYKCQHCGCIVFCCDPVTKWPKHPDDCGGRCARCKERVCFKCKAVGECDPEEEKLRRMERRAMEQAMRDPTVRALRDQVKAEQELKSKIEDQWTRLFK